MHRYFLLRYLSALSCGLLGTLLFSADATAVDPETSTVVSAYEIRPEEGVFFELRDNARIAAVGRDECVSMFEDNTPVGFFATFPNNQTGRAYVFATPTNETPQDFECDAESQNNCRNVENIQAFGDPRGQIDFSYGQEIDFANLVEEAVEGQADTNEIELLRTVNDCTETEIDQEYFFRLVFDTNTTTTQEIFDLVVHVDTERPAPPEAVSSVVVTENTIFLNWQQEQIEDLILDPDDEVPTERNLAPFVVFYSDRDITGESLEALESADDVQSSAIRRDNPNDEGPQFSGDAALDGVDVGDSGRIWVAVAARDDVGNLSEPVYPEGSEDGFEVVPVIDFWENYKEAGGQETGCNTANTTTGDAPLSGAAVVFAVMGLGWLGWRRRRRLRQILPLIAGVLAFGATVGISPDASAQSETWGIAEIRLGGYYPSIDEEAGLTGQPFEEIFGSSNRVLIEYEHGYHLYDGFGAFGASGSIGYTHFGGDVLFEENVEIESDALAEETGFMVVPIRAGLYYRIDQFEKTWDIPLVPVVKAGLDYVLWQAEAPNGDASTAGGDEGEGTTYGWHASAGLHLQLDWLEPTSAAAFDYNWGINSTYAFAEYMHMEVDDFGASDSFILSDDLWMFGLAFEY